MATNPTLSTRVEPDVVARVEALVPLVNAHARRPGERYLDRGAIVRLMILDTLNRWERRYGVAVSKPAPKKSTAKKQTTAKKRAR
jgi:hypothetical protein